MFREERIGTREAVAAAIHYLSTKLFIAFPQQMATVGMTAAWIVPIISFGAGALGFLIIGALLRRHPGMGLVEIGEEVGGPTLGFLASAGYLSFFFISTILVMREFSETVNTALLPRTPLSVIMGAFILAMLFAAFLGIEALTRAALLSVPFIVGTLVVLGLLLLPQSNFDAIFPLLGPGAGSLFHHGVSHAAVAGEVVFLGVIADQLKEENKVRAMGLVSILTVAAFTVLALLVYSAAFPYPLSEHIPYPGYEASTLIYLGRFFQRVEVAFVFLWVGGGCIQLGLGIYMSANILARMLKLPMYRPLLPALGIIGYTLAFLPPSVPVTTRLDFEVVRTYGGFAVFVVPAVLLLIAQIRAMRGETRGRRP